MNVPEILAVSDDGMRYLQEDLGTTVLYDMYARTGMNREAEALLCSAMAALPRMQVEGADGLDFSVCYPQPEFDRRMVMFDLNYFKYCFLKPSGLEFNEVLLQDDLERFADDLLSCSSDFPVFLYRDFNPRNVMVRDGQPWFIDFQGGRKGPLHYDVASFIWHARSGFTPDVREKMLQAYLDALSVHVEYDRDDFLEKLKLFVLFRTLQVLGAYGFRGWVEQKANFVVSIPQTIRALADLLAGESCGDFMAVRTRYPYMCRILEDMTGLPGFDRSGFDDVRLNVTITSFSFKKGIPRDPSGNGGGYVFDCRSIHNPGRYQQYKQLTGMDEPVIRFLEDDGEIVDFLSHVYGVVDPHVETYSSRGFTSLMVNFGCTGGQHRSVYCAEHLASHLATKYPSVRVRLIHREQGKDIVL
jgi:aminoglycoside/choline kinase family phosphotransferase